jgi:CO dehydrogenase/acetyl-CoA synthase beta subunit
MSKKVTKIVCLDKAFYGKKLILPTIGETEIPEDGIIEVEEAIAKILTEGSSDWDLQGDKKKVKKVAVVEEEEDDEEEEEDEEEDGLEGDEAIKSQLEQLELKDLVAMAEKAEYPASEIKSIKKNKKLMVNYLLKKSKEENK